MNTWQGLMLAAGGLFAGGAATFAWSRVPIWRRMPLPEFLRDFEQTLQWTDKVQPALLVTAIVGTIAYALTTDGSGRGVAIAAATGFVATLGGSLGYLVPLQRRIIATPVQQAASIEEMRLRWFTGNFGRSLLATAAFVLAVVAVTVNG